LQQRKKVSMPWRIKKASTLGRKRERTMAREIERPSIEGREHAHPKTSCNKKERERMMAREREPFDKRER
jgi:hypothetical protein